MLSVIMDVSNHTLLFYLRPWTRKLNDPLKARFSCLVLHTLREVLKYFLILDIKRMMIELRSVILRHSEKGKSFGCNIFMAYDLHVSAMFTSSSKDDNMCRMFLITVQLRKKKSVTPSTSAASLHKSLHYLEQRYQKQRTRKCLLFFAILNIFISFIVIIAFFIDFSKL
jgi:hypothetical protein